MYSDRDYRKLPFRAQAKKKEPENPEEEAHAVDAPGPGKSL